MNSPSLLYSCSYHLVHYDVWHKKKEEKDLKLPEICYNGCVYVREDSNPGGLKFWNNNLSTQQMTSTASRGGEKKWSASMVCAVWIFPLNRIFLFWGIKFLVRQKIASFGAKSFGHQSLLIILIHVIGVSETSTLPDDDHDGYGYGGDDHNEEEEEGEPGDLVAEGAESAWYGLVDKSTHE